MTEGPSPPSPLCLLPHRRDEGGGNPFSFVFFSTQTQREGFPPSPVCFFPHRHDEQGFPPLCCVSFHTDMTRRGKPFLHCVLMHTDMTGGGLPPLHHVINFDATRRRNLSLSRQTPFSMGRGGENLFLLC